MNHAATEIKLTQPILVDGLNVDTLNLRRPVARDLRAVRNGASGMDFILDLAATCCAVPPSSIDQMDIADALKLTEVVSGFLGIAPPTGKT